MWNDANSLSKLSASLLALSLLMVAFAALHFAIHLPMFAFRVVQLEAVPRLVDTGQVETVVRSELRGNFFTMDLNQARAALEKLPWVRKASLRRHFPWQLDIDLEEQEAMAHWNGTQLVNSFGEVFAAKTNMELPYFSGPDDDTSAEVMQKFASFTKLLAPIGQEIVQISLSPRLAWQLRLKSGMVLELGREEMEQRLARFAEVYPYSLANAKQPVRHVDLRYRKGFAVSMAGGQV